MHELPELANALKAYEPEIARRYDLAMRSAFGRMVEAHGPTLDGVANSWEFAKFYYNTLKRFVAYDAKRVASLREDALHAAAQAYAADTTQEWYEKILGKVQTLENAKVAYMDSNSRFSIAGQRGGCTVAIHQNIIVNVSSKGMIFNQFPAHIYVDGKKLSEAAYKRRFAKPSA